LPSEDASSIRPSWQSTTLWLPTQYHRNGIGRSEISPSRDRLQWFSLPVHRLLDAGRSWLAGGLWITCRCSQDVHADTGAVDLSTATSRRLRANIALLYTRSFPRPATLAGGCDTGLYRQFGMPLLRSARMRSGPVRRSP